MFKVLITGPESSGKSVLSNDLALHFSGELVKEYSREYLENKDTYSEPDLYQIAKGQFRDESVKEQKSPAYLFCDTGLEVIEIWSEEKYNRVNPEITVLSKQAHYDLVLLCKPNIPWQQDRLRENPTDRDRLFDIYERKLVNEGVRFKVINASIEDRLEQAIRFIKRFCNQ